MFLVRFVLWFIRFTGDITNEFIEKNVPFMCASISFYAFFSLFPFFISLSASQTLVQILVLMAILKLLFLILYKI